MMTAIASLTLLGVVLGMLLGIAGRFLRVEGNVLAEEIATLLPGTNCGQCGFPGCAGAAAAMCESGAAPTLCPAVDQSLAAEIAARLGIDFNTSAASQTGPRVAVVDESLCIGCCRCARACATDAIVGASRQIHTVLADACTGCGSCVEPCPTAALSLQPEPASLPLWIMPCPAQA